MIMNYFDKIRKELSSGDAKFSSDAVLTAILMVVIALVVVFGIISSTYDSIAYDFDRTRNVSIFGGLAISFALYWGTKVGNLVRIAKILLRDFSFYKFTIVDIGAIVYFFCHWIFWSALIASCYLPVFDASSRFGFAILCVFLLLLFRVLIEVAIALQRIAENTSPSDSRSLPGS